VFTASKLRRAAAATASKDTHVTEPLFPEGGFLLRGFISSQLLS
jgi:hypothetical protein